ncbi:hypothetical protein ACJMK2_039624, partial [Sinanodonta woodiana]
WTQENVELETLESSTRPFREISTVESDIGIILFQLLDQQIKQDKKVTLTEYITLWSRADSNNDKYVSAQEVNTFLEQHLLGPSSNAERIFGGTDLANDFSVKILFKYFDRN